MSEESDLVVFPKNASFDWLRHRQVDVLDERGMHRVCVKISIGKVK
jgi:hypothetical protein